MKNFKRKMKLGLMAGVCLFATALGFGMANIGEPTPVSTVSEVDVTPSQDVDYSSLTKLTYESWEDFYADAKNKTSQYAQKYFLDCYVSIANTEANKAAIEKDLATECILSGSEETGYSRYLLDQFYGVIDFNDMKIDLSKVWSVTAPRQADEGKETFNLTNPDAVADVAVVTMGILNAVFYESKESPGVAYSIQLDTKGEVGTFILEDASVAAKVAEEDVQIGSNAVGTTIVYDGVYTPSFSTSYNNIVVKNCYINIFVTAMAGSIDNVYYENCIGNYLVAGGSLTMGANFYLSNCYVKSGYSSSTATVVDTTSKLVLRNVYGAIASTSAVFSTAPTVVGSWGGQTVYKGTTSKTVNDSNVVRDIRFFTTQDYVTTSGGSTPIWDGAWDFETKWGYYMTTSSSTSGSLSGSAPGVVCPLPLAYLEGSSYWNDASKTGYRVNLYDNYTGTTAAKSVRLYTSASTLSSSTIYFSRAGYVHNWSYSPDGAGAASVTISNNTPLYAIWREATYTITYKANGGSGSDQTQTVTYNKSFTTKASNTFSRTGYTFSKWSTSSSSAAGSYQSAGTSYTYSNTSSITLYAIWTANKYKVTLDNQSATTAGTTAYWYYYNTSKTVSGYSSTVYYYSNEACTTPIGDGSVITKPTKTGYTFGGYYTSTGGSGTQYVNANGGCVNSIYTARAADTTLYAKWTANGYTITYKANGGTGSDTTQSVTYNSSFTTKASNTFSRTGYTFSKWSTSSSSVAGSYQNASTSYTYSTAGNTTLYAIWTINTYTLTVNNGYYHAASGTGITLAASGCTISDTSLVSGQTGVTVKKTYSTTAISVTFTTTNTSNSHWVCLYLDGASYTSGSNSATYTWTPNANHTITWYIREYHTVKAVAGTGISAATFTTYLWSTSSAMTSSSTVMQGSTATFSATVKSGYTWSGWTGSATSSNNPYTTGEISSDITMTANATANPYTVTYKANGGTGSDATQAVTYNSSFTTKAASTFTKSGYYISKWNTAANGSGTSYNCNTAYTYSTVGNLTLYAIWDGNSYTVSYNANGGTGTVSSQTVKYGSSFTTRANAFSRSGYTWGGWSTSASSLAGSYQKASTAYTYSTVGNTTLYAYWTANVYTITLDPKYYTSSSDTSGDAVTSNGTTTLYVKYNTGWYSNSTASTAVSSITKPTKTGYTFQGYYTGKYGTGTQIINSSGTILSGKTTTWTAAATLYAHYTATGYTITYNSNYGTATTSTQAVTYNSSFTTKASNTFTRTGYSFSKWSTSSTSVAGSYQNANTSYTYSTAGNTTLYAIWSANTYKVVLNQNYYDVDTTTGTLTTAGGTVSGFSNVNYMQSSAYSGGKYILAHDTWEIGLKLSYTGSNAYVFNTAGTSSTYSILLGISGGNAYMWYSTTGSSWAKNASIGAMKATVGAYTWVKVSYASGKVTASYSHDGVNYTTSSNWNGVTLGKPYGTTSSKITVGYAWSDSYYDHDSIVDFGDTYISVNGKIAWGNKGTVINATYGSAYSALTTPVRAGYTFNGWYTAPTGGTKYTTSTTVATASNHTLYAQWSGKSVTLTYDANGGSVSSASKSVTVGSTYGTLATPTRTGYDFKGWAKNLFDVNDFIRYFNTYGSTSSFSVDADGVMTVAAPWGYFGSGIGSVGHYLVKPITLEAGTYKVSYMGRHTDSSTNPTTGISLVRLTSTTSPTSGNGMTLDGKTSAGAMSGVGNAYVSSSAWTQYSYSFTLSAAETLYIELPYYYGYTTYFKDVRIELITPSNGTYDDVISSSSKVEYPGAHTTTALWALHTYTLTISRGTYYGEPPHATNLSITASGCTISGNAAIGTSATIKHTYSTTAITVTLTRSNTSYNYVLHNNSSGSWANPTNTFSFTWTPSADKSVSVHIVETFVPTATKGTGISSVSIGAQTSSGGSYSTDYNGKTIWQCYGLQYNAVVATGYTFKGWFTNSSGTGTAVSTSTSYTHSTYSLTGGAKAGPAYYAIATPNTYTVTAFGNGGTIPSTTGWTVASGSASATKTVTYASTYGTLPTPTKTGYTFSGWKKAYYQGSKTLTASSSSDYTYAELCSVSAGVTYQISIQTATKTSGSATGFSLLLHDFTNSKTLDSRIVSFGSNVSCTLTCPTNATGTNIKLLVYAGPAGSTASNAVSYTNIVVSRSSDSTITSSSTVSTASDHTLHAYYTANRYGVTLNANNGSLTVSSPVYALYDSATLYTTSTGSTACTPKATRSGYTFSGFYTAASGGTQVITSAGALKASVSGYTDSSGRWIKAGTATLYAQWSAVTFKVTANANGGTVTTANGWTIASDKLTASKSIAYGSAFGTLPVATRGGYTFNGWTRSGSSTILTTTDVLNDAVGSTAAGAELLVIYANWTVNTYTISYTLNSGTISGTQPVRYNVTGAYSTSTSGNLTGSSGVLPSATRTGYSFGGWSVGTAVGNWSATTYAASTALTGKYGNVALSAVWNANRYAVTFNANGGSFSSTPATAYAVYGTKNYYTATSGTTAYTFVAPTRTGYTFLGYSATDRADASTNTTSLADYITYSSSTFTVAKNWDKTAATTLYAVWKNNTYTITYNANGGTGSNVTQSAVYNNTYTTKASNTFTKTGYTLAGWKTSASATSATYSCGATATCTGNVTLYAHWTINSYTLTVSFSAYKITNASNVTVAATDQTSKTLTSSSSTATFTYNYSTTAKTITVSRVNTARNYCFWLTSKVGSTTQANAGGSDNTCSVAWTPTGNGTVTIQFVEYFNVSAVKGTGIASATFDSYYSEYRDYSGLTSASNILRGSTATFNATASAGYTFEGWYNGSTKISGAGATYEYGAVTTDLSLTAKTTANSYTIKYVDTDGTTQLGTSTYNIESAAFALKNFTKTGYSVSEWQVSRTDTSAYGGTWTTAVQNGKIGAGATIAKGSYGNITLKVVWAPNTTNIGLSYIDFNYGDIASVEGPSTHRATYDATVSAITKPTGYNTVAYAPGYNFLGFYTQEGGSGSKIFNADGSVVTSAVSGWLASGGIWKNASANVTVYAHWSTIGYTLTLNKGTGVASVGASGTGVAATATAGVYTVQFGSTVTLSFTRSAGYSGGSWSVTSGSVTLTDASSTTAAKYTHNKPNAVTLQVGNLTANNVNYVVRYRKILASGSEGDYSTVTKSAATGSSITLATAQAAATDTGNLNGFTYSSNRWYKEGSSSASGTNASSFTVQGDASLIIELVYAPTKYTITFNSNGGSAVSTVYYNIYGQYSTSSTGTLSGAYTLPTPTKTGYDFAGWKVDTAVGGWTGTLAAGTAAANKYGNVSLTAQWTGTYYTVTFAPNGGTVDTTTKQVQYASNYGTLPTPNRSGYTFAGWDLNGTTITSSSTVSTASNHTLTAKWTAIEYTITYTANKGTGANVTQKATYDAKFTTKASNTFSRTGYTFAGWSTSTTSLAGSYQKASTEYTYNTANNLTLNAYWSANKYTINLNGNGGSTTVGTVTNLTKSGTTLTATYDTSGTFVATMTRTGFTFKGWSSSNSELVAVTGLTNGTISNNASTSTVLNMTSTANGVVNLYAIWEANYVTVTMDLGISQGSTSVTFNGTSYTSSSTMPKMYVKYGDATTPSTYANLKLTTTGSAVGLLSPTRMGYTFAGWYSNSALTSAVEASTNVISASAHTLYAKWTAISYTVTYHNNDGTSASYTDTKKAVFDQEYTVLTEAQTGLSRQGYTFSTWNTASAGTGTNYPAGGKIVFTYGQNFNLYAIRTANLYEVSIDYQGGRGDITTFYYRYQTVDANGTAYFVDSALTQRLASTWVVPTRDGYTFGGYYAQANGQGTQYFSASLTANQTASALYKTVGNKSIYAYWTINSANVTVEGNGGTFTNTPSGWTKTDNDTLTASNKNFGTVMTMPTAVKTGYTVTSWQGDYTYMGVNDEFTHTGSTYYTIPEKFKFDTSDALTVSIWGYSDNWSSFGTNAAAMISCTNDGGWALQVRNQEIQIWLSVQGITGNASNTAYQMVSFAELSDLSSGWHQFAFTFDGRYLKAYLDGALANQRDCGSYSTIREEFFNQYVYVGMECPYGANSTAQEQVFTGKTKNVYISNRVAEASEIASMYSDETSYYKVVARETIYANWTANTVRVNLNLNNSASSTSTGAFSGTNGTIYITYDSTNIYGARYSITQPSGSVIKPIATRTGYTFAGWYDAATGGNQIIAANGVLLKNWTSSDADGVVLYAHWSARQVAYKVNVYEMDLEGKYSTTPSQVLGANGDLTASADETVTISSTVYTKTGFVYDSSASNVTTLQIKADGTTVFKLYYKRIGTTLTVNPNGGSYEGSTSSTVIEGLYGQTTTIADPTRENYLFTGWQYSGGGSINWLNGLSDDDLRCSVVMDSTDTTGFSKYSNSSNPPYSDFTITGIADSTSSTGYSLKISSPASNNKAGGVARTVVPEAGEEFYVKLTAKIPVGFNLVFTHNTCGVGMKSVALTSTAGTGSWADYIFYFKSGEYGRKWIDFGYFYLTNSTSVASMDWYVNAVNYYEKTTQEPLFTFGDENATFVASWSASGATLILDGNAGGEAVMTPNR